MKEFNDYLATWPKGKLAGTEDVLYWAKDTFGLKPVVSAYHATFYKSPRGGLISNKLLAATHFFNAGLELLAARADRRRQGPLPPGPLPDADSTPRPACWRASSWARSGTGSRPA